MSLPPEITALIGGSKTPETGDAKLAASLQNMLQLDAMKVSVLLEKMDTLDLPNLTAQQRDCIALGWLYATFYRNLDLLDDMVGTRNAITTMIGTFTVWNVDVENYYAVREKVIAGYLDGEEFDAEGKNLKHHPFFKTLDSLQRLETRRHELQKAKKAVQGDGEGQSLMDMLGELFGEPVIKKDKKVVN